VFSKNSRVFIDVSSKMTVAKQIGGVVISVVIFLAVRKWCEASRKNVAISLRVAISFL
jgi:hypothetical protein